MSRDIPFYKSRSLTTCVADGWRMTAIEWRKFLKDTWLFSFIFGLSVAFFAIQLTFYLASHALPALRLSEQKADPILVNLVARPDLISVICLAITFGITVFSYYLYKGRAVSALRYYKRHDRQCGLMPPTIMTADRKAIKGLCLIDLPLFILTAILLAGIYFGLKAALDEGAALYTLLVSPLILIWIGSWKHIARIEYTINLRSYSISLKKGLKQSLGTSFILQILTSIPLACFAMVCLLPILIFLGASLANADTMLVSDPNGIPGYVTFIYFVLIALSSTLYAIASLVPERALSLKLGQIK